MAYIVPLHIGHKNTLVYPIHQISHDTCKSMLYNIIYYIMFIICNWYITLQSSIKTENLEATIKPHMCEWRWWPTFSMWLSKQLLVMVGSTYRIIVFRWKGVSTCMYTSPINPSTLYFHHLHVIIILIMTLLHKSYPLPQRLSTWITAVSIYYPIHIIVSTHPHCRSIATTHCTPSDSSISFWM